MPVYAFKNKSTGEVTEHKMRVAELDGFTKAHPELERFFSAETCNIQFKIESGGSRLKSMNGGISKVDPKFETEVIGRIKRNVHGNTLDKTHKSSQENYK